MIEETIASRCEWESFFDSAALLPSIQERGSQRESDLPRSVLVAAFDSLAPKIETYRAEIAVRQHTNPQFNVFDFIKPTENTLSDILRFFLDPAESHGQGDIFLLSLINRLISGLR